MGTRLTPEQLLEQQPYCVLSTCDRTCLPWVTPMYYGYDEQWQIYWISARSSFHSRLLVDNPYAAVVIYNPPDSGGEVSALYLTGFVAECGEHELEEALGFYLQRGEAIVSRNPKDYLHTNPSRMYRLESSRAFTLGEAEWDGNLLVDKRIEVPIPKAK